MTLLFSDGFDSYAATADVLAKWFTFASPWEWSSTAGRSGGGAIQAATTGNAVARPPVQEVTANNGIAVGMGFWLKISAAPGSASILARSIDPNANMGGTLRVNTSGMLVHHSTNGSAIVAGPTNVCDNDWHWVEVYWSVSTTNGTEKCFVDGVTQWNGVLGWNNNNPIKIVEFLSITGVTLTIDDFLLFNSAGSDFLPSSIPYGARLITTLRPSADTADKDFARSTGDDNYALIDEVNLDTADYVESGTSGDQDLYDYSDLGFTPTQVNAVVLNAVVTNPAGGTVNFQQSAKSSSTTSQGTSTAAPASARTHQEPFYADPNGSIPWTGSAVDAAQFGIKVA